MQLGLFNGANRTIDSVRTLKASEMHEHRTHTKLISEVRNRLALFRMLERNYQDFRSFVDDLISAKYKDQRDDGENLDRLILNYLTFAYSIQEHFSVSYKRRFKSDTAQLKKYADFINRLCEASWPFAFVLDFRGFVQHRGLAVGSFKRSSTHASAKVKITTDPKRLLQGSRTWERSKITENSKPIDLIEVLHGFHQQMQSSYANFVATTFYPELIPASKFYGALTKEVKAVAPLAQMIFLTSKPRFRLEDRGKVAANVNYVLPPNDVFHELGILLPRSDPSQSS